MRKLFLRYLSKASFQKNTTGQYFVIKQCTKHCSMFDLKHSWIQLDAEWQESIFSFIMTMQDSLSKDDSTNNREIRGLCRRIVIQIEDLRLLEHVHKIGR